MAKYVRKQSSEIVEQWQEEVSYNKAWKKATNDTKWYGLKYDTFKKMEKGEPVMDNTLVAMYECSPEFIRLKYKNFQNFLAHYFEELIVVPPASLEAPQTETLQTPVAAPQLFEFKAQRFVWKNKPMRIRWHGLHINEVMVRWRKDQEQQYHFLEPTGNDRSFVPPHSGGYTFLVRSETGQEIVDSFWVWTLQPLKILVGLGLVVAAIFLFLKFK